MMTCNESLGTNFVNALQMYLDVGGDNDAIRTEDDAKPLTDFLAKRAVETVNPQEAMFVHVCLNWL